MSVPATVHTHRLRAPTVAAVLGVFVFLHGAAHVVGVSGNIGMISDHKSAELLGGAWRLSNRAGLAALAGFWAASGLAVLAAAVALLRNDPNARRWLIAAGTVSLVLSVVNLWAAVIGVVINTALVALAWKAPRYIGLREGESQ